MIEEARGHRTISASSIDRIGITRRWSYPTFLVEADGVTCGVPLHQAADSDQSIVDLIRCAFADRNRVDLEIRRSAFWRMDGSLDEIAAVITESVLVDPAGVAGPAIGRRLAKITQVGCAVAAAPRRAVSRPSP